MLNTSPRITGGSIFVLDRTRTEQYRRDGYEWKTKKGSLAVREDHVKLKVQGVPRVYATYVHSERVEVSEGDAVPCVILAPE
jgi:hypothetical protein